MVSFATRTGAQVVAEGIEAVEDVADLARMGCAYGQSYLFGAPMGADSILRLLKERFVQPKRA